MRFQFSKKHLKPRQKRLQRLLEMVPGISSWAVLIGMVLISIFLPFIGAIFFICFYLCWLLRLLYMTLFLVLSYFRLNIERKTDWMARLRGLDDIANYLNSLQQSHGLLSFRRRLSLWTHRKEINTLLDTQQFPPRLSDIHHLVIFPIIKEDRHIIEPAVKALEGQSFPPKKTIVVFALEERADQRIHQDIASICQDYRNSFFDCITVVHPDGIPGEARVKGANVTYAARFLTSYILNRDIALENVIVSCFDADTVVSRDYFACLTYHYMITPDRLQASFQPIPMYHNNIWQAPSFARVIEIGSSFFQLIEATNPEKLVTFSSHSMSFRALVDVDYWPVDMISDDSAIFWKCYLHYNGHYRVVPMYVTLSMDVVCSSNWFSTITSVYKQKRRWAWGVENFPIVMRGFLLNNRIPLYDKIRHGFKLFEGHLSWATWGFLLSVIGWMPATFARREFSTSVVYYNVPEIANTIFNLASLCLITSIILSLLLLPRPTTRTAVFIMVTHAFEWLMLPFILVFFGALPALDAQTRLMLGKYLEFWVTDKHRKGNTLIQKDG